MVSPDAPSKTREFACLAVDLGASSGRVIAARFDGERIAFEETHRFENGPTEREGTLYWDFDSLMREIVEGLRKGVASVRRGGSRIRSIAIDSWGVDFGLLDKAGRLITWPVHYRDSRTDGVMDFVFKTLIPKKEIHRRTGLQFLPFNTIYQLAALKRDHPDQLARAESFLMIADLVQYRLTGQVLCEFTNATTTQLYDPTLGGWSDDLIGKLGLPRRIFPRIVAPGTTIGKLRPEMAERIGDADIDVVATATHDTGSAVAAVPTRSPRFAYLSCGTWSLLGTEVRKPVITDQSLEFGLTNEGGVDNTYRLLKNIMGLWLLQESRSEWKKQGRDYGWDRITSMADEAEPFRSAIDPDDPTFLPPGDMPSRIREYCRAKNQPVPETDAQVVRCILESLALKYSYVMERLEILTGSSLPTLHLVGGGIRNRALCQFTADAVGREVIAGPVEATALGNVGVQLMAAGLIPNLEALRGAIERSENPVRYSPRDPDPWRAAVERFGGLLA